MRKTALLLTVGLALAACSANNSFQNGEAGDGIGTKSTGFGTANAQNTAVMSGDQTYAINLTRKFASEVPNTVNFAFNSSALSPQARSALARQASWIRQFPQIRFRVYGYTDLVGSNAYNKALGMRRARAVVQFLETQGISRQRLEAVVSYGETRPLVYTPAPNEANRRAVTEVSGFISGGKPMPMDGKYAEVVYNEYINSAKPAQTIVIKGKDGGGGGGG
ncbi:membrane protein [Thioclava dalianensis]|uniref:Membrane protein n=2 Tax=Thioclava dalianensis TaxID=1185766 RepID=A0A074TGX2_9RHOB|nr:OmpA family protein [Thioclava dalianensis]KEP68248.1 membrane protein [Thioclava dalianensis]